MEQNGMKRKGKEKKKERTMNGKSLPQSFHKISSKNIFVNIKPLYISNLGKMRLYIKGH